MGVYKATHTLLNILTDKENYSSMERGLATHALGNVDDPVSVETLTDFLMKDDDVLICTFATNVLIQIGDNSAVDALIYALKKDFL